MERWDTKLIEMLHSCEAGEKAILTGFIPGHLIKDSNFIYSDMEAP